MTQPANAPPIPGLVRHTGRVDPDRLYVTAAGYDARQTRKMAADAVRLARAAAPKLSGAGAAGIKPYYGNGYFGLRWSAPYLWYQESGIRPFTMRSLAGKVIPMWLDDPTGSIRRDNPKAKTRITLNGRRQTLLFRKAAPLGARKTTTRRRADGSLLRRDVPASYPGAPGRITQRQWRNFPDPSGRTGRIVSTPPQGHIGVRWRHPGLPPRHFMQHSLQQVAGAYGLDDTVHATNRRH